MKPLILFVAIVFATVCACAAADLPEEGPMNATVLGDVNVRQDTPSITFRSLFTLKMEQALWLDVLRAEARVRVLGERVVVGRYLWYRVAYDKGGVRRVGWVYSGKVRDEKRYVALDSAPEGMRRVPSAPFIPAALAALLSPSAAWALDGPPVDNDAGSEILSGPRVTASAVTVFLFLIGSLLLFRWIFKGNSKYVCLFGFSVLVIFGVFSPKIIEVLLGGLPEKMELLSWVKHWF